MALELNCSSRQAFVMRVNGSTLRLTLREFALISGLNCVNEENDFIFDESESNRFMEKYFEGVKLIRKIDIMRSFHRKWKAQSVSMGEKSFLFDEEETEQEVAQKVDDHIPRLLNWQTTNESRRYKKLMNTIFSDVNNKIKFRNITPNQRELEVLQLPSEGIENQAPPQYSDSSADDLDDELIDNNDDPREGSCDDQDSDDDFQAPPPQAVKVAKNLEPRISVKQPMKKNVVSKKRTRGSEVEGWLKELSDFIKEVKQEFVEIRNLINDNFKTVLTAINSTRDEQEHSDDHIVPPNSNDEDGYEPPYTSNKESPSNQVLVVQCDKLESGNSEDALQQRQIKPLSMSIWVRTLIYRKHDQDHYKKNLAEIPVAINLGVLLIDNKNWFYNLYFKGKLLNNSHVDVILYYLRKEAKYDVGGSYKYTTVDSCHW
uniref:DUF1985 domain-containing protein n=1 Tax=Solanum lycopersicum TaxID=4081 RepID=A0A3Q7GDQ9_SOLLC